MCKILVIFGDKPLTPIHPHLRDEFERKENIFLAKLQLRRSRLGPSYLLLLQGVWKSDATHSLLPEAMAVLSLTPPWWKLIRQINKSGRILHRGLATVTREQLQHCCRWSRPVCPSFLSSSPLSLFPPPT